MARTRWAGIAAGLLALAGCAAPDAGFGIPPVTVDGARTAPAPLPGRLLLPAGPGPHPLVIVLHGCSGISQRMDIWTGRLRDWGYGSLVLDSLKPRSVTSVCAPNRQALVTRFDRAGDVVAAARWLQTQPGVDGKRLAVLGESHGGSTAATVALHPFSDALAGMVQGAIDYYGNCRDPGRYGGMPLLAMAGDADTWGPPAATCVAFGAALPPGLPFMVKIYPGVVHGFDSPNLMSLRYNEGHPLQYDPAAAADSFARVRAFLERTIGPGG